MKKTRQITFCALMSALGAVVLLLGGITRVLDLTAVMVATALVYVAFEETKYFSILVYGVIGGLAFLLPIEISVAVEFLIFGIYPVVKALLERLPKIVAWIFKAIFMSASFVGLTLLLQFVLGYPEVWYINLIFCLAGIIMYVIFDIALTRFDRYYQGKLRRQLRIDKFFR